MSLPEEGFSTNFQKLCKVKNCTTYAHRHPSVAINSLNVIFINFVNFLIFQILTTLKIAITMKIFN